MPGFRFPSAPVWRFRAGRFTVELYVTRDSSYRYDGDDEDGETQAMLDSGELVAFDSQVVVSLDGEQIASDHLGGSVYKCDDVPDFWTAHRGPDAMDRNCSIMRAKRGANVCICHYFPDMVRAAISEARDAVRAMTVPPRIRESAK
jgi:hypothetical protein